MKKSILAVALILGTYLPSAHAELSAANEDAEFAHHAEVVHRLYTKYFTTPCKIYPQLEVCDFSLGNNLKLVEPKEVLPVTMVTPSSIATDIAGDYLKDNYGFDHQQALRSADALEKWFKNLKNRNYTTTRVELEQIYTAAVGASFSEVALSLRASEQNNNAPLEQTLRRIANHFKTTPEKARLFLSEMTANEPGI